MVRFTSFALAAFAFGASVSALAVAGTADFQVVRRDGSAVSLLIFLSPVPYADLTLCSRSQAVDKRAFNGAVAVAPAAIKARSLVDEVELQKRDPVSDAVATLQGALSNFALLNNLPISPAVLTSLVQTVLGLLTTLLGGLTGGLAIPSLPVGNAATSLPGASQLQDAIAGVAAATGLPIGSLTSGQLDGLLSLVVGLVTIILGGTGLLGGLVGGLPLLGGLGL